MSASIIQRSAMSPRIAELPQLPPPSPTRAPHVLDGNKDEDEKENDDLGELPSSMGPPKQPSRASNLSKPISSEFAPAANYFTQTIQVPAPTTHLSFRVYYTPSSIPGSKGSVMVCHHGPGSSALSFACFAKEVERLSNGECGVLALDAREHGKTIAGWNPVEFDLSLDRLGRDLIELLRTMFLSPSEAPSLFLVGHSMGGVVVLRARHALLALKYKVAGVAVLDVVEEALPKLLDSRPDGFDTLEDAIQWHISTKTIRNPQSARVSVPAMFVSADAPSSSGPLWRWRTPLRSMAPFRSNWFTILWVQFHITGTPLLLVLDGTERLDENLMIAKRQGKFQVVVVPDVGHTLHEESL